MLFPELWFFRRLRLDERMPASAFDALRDRARVERWGHNAQIYRHADAEHVYVIVRGSVELTDGGTTEVVRLRRGDVFGETGLDPQPTSSGLMPAQLRAIDETTLCILQRAAFDHLAGEYLGQIRASGGLLGRREFEMPVQSLLFTSPANRLVKVLSSIAEANGLEERSDPVFEVPLRPGKLARLTGMDRGRVKTLLRLLQSHGLEFRNGRAVIADLDTLRTFASTG